MSMTIATNIRLPEDLLKALKYKAIEEKKSMNQLIREAIEISLADVPRSQGREKDSFEDIIGIAKSGTEDDDSVKSRPNRRHSKKLQMQGARILRNEAYIEVRRNDERRSATQQMDFLRSRQGWVFKT